MLGWSGVCYQFYQIYNYEHQQQMIQIDGYPYVEVDQGSQLLIYSFPREDCIRLDELLNLIRSDYVKIYGAQALKLIQAIIQHHGQIREKKKFYGNLTSRNVWIVFGKQSQGSNGSERLRCIFSKLNYKIHFTGYQKEPMKGDYDLDNECSQVVTDILNVLEDCQSSDDRKAQSKKQMSLEKMKLMLLPYAQEQYKLLEQIEKTFQDYNYDKDEQRFKELDSKQYTKANTRGGDTFKKTAETIKTLFQENPIQQLNTLNDKVKWRMTTLLKEIQFWNLLPKIVKEVKGMYYSFYLKKELKQIELIEPSIIDLIKAINNLKSEFYGLMLEEFQKELDEEFGQVFKIEIILDQTVTEPHYMNLFRAAIAEYMNDLDSFKSLNVKWLKNHKEFEAAIFKKHKPYLLQKNVELFVKEGEAFVASLV